MGKWPHKIRIKSRVSYELAWVDRFDDPDQLGECRYEPVKQILVKTGMSDRETFDTIVHETLHAMCREYEIDMKHQHVYAMEEAVRKLLQLNNWLPKKGRSK